MNTFSEKLEYQRLLNDITKEDLADKLNIARQTLYNYLAGRNPNWELMQKVHKIFPNISMDYWIIDSISKNDYGVNISNRINSVEEEAPKYISSEEFNILNKKLDLVLQKISN